MPWFRFPMWDGVFLQAKTKADFQRCEALRSCVEDNSDDQASLQGCMALAEDAYVLNKLWELVREE
jgi:hypothetical protein